jgi:hypothetical protein
MHAPRAWVAAIVAALACMTGPVRAADTPYTRAQMETGAETAAWLFIYGTRDPDATAALEARAKLVARRLFNLDSTRVRADHDVTDAQLKSHSLIVFGAPRENAVTARLGPGLPVRFEPRAFTWAGTRYEQADDVIHLVYPNPRAPKRFLLLIAGNSAEAMTRRGGGFWFGDSDWRIYRAGELVRSGSFRQTASAPWAYDAALDRDRERERDTFAASLKSTEARGVLLRAAPVAGDTGTLRAGAEVALARMGAMGFAAPGDPPVEITVYATLEQKGAIVRDTRPGHLDSRGLVHIAMPFGSERMDGRAVAAARLVRMGARPDGAWLDPAASWLAGRFEGETLERSLARLYFGRILPNAEEAAADPGRWRSPLIVTPARALLLRAIYELAGVDGPAAIGRVLAAEPAPHLNALCATARVQATAVRVRYSSLSDSLARIGRAERGSLRPKPWRPGDGFQSGVCLAHAVSLERGYLSASCAAELKTLRGMGAGWVSLTPFGYLPSQSTPQIRPSSEGGTNEETDESIVEAGRRARAEGLRVWLKPHLWTRGWIGELAFSPAGWDEFFQQYREFILHYALIAEREGFDGLVVGHELVTSSLGFPDRWRAIIGDVRRVYGGTLTYGANWGDEVKKIQFWDALDVVAVSFYEPLAEAKASSVATLRAGAQKALAGLKAISDRTGKPVLLAEVGYAPMDEAALRPWEERQGGIDLETQRACYEALVGAMDGQSWIAGAFFWKWFTSAEIGGPQDSSFSPRGKPAETVMRRAFQAWGKRRVGGR